MGYVKSETDGSRTKAVSPPSLAGLLFPLYTSVFQWADVLGIREDPAIFGRESAPPTPLKVGKFSNQRRTPCPLKNPLQSPRRAACADSTSNSKAFRAVSRYMPWREAPAMRYRSFLTKLSAFSKATVLPFRFLSKGGRAMGDHVPVSTVSAEKDALVRRILSSGRYLVTEEGKVFDRRRKRGNVSGGAVELKQRKFNSGHLMVCLATGTVPRQVSVSVSRVVATVFLPTPCVCLGAVHKDGNKQNNHVSNLAWMDSFEAMQKASGNGLLRIYRGSEHKNAKLSEDQAREIKKLLNEGVGATAAALRVGTCRALVRAIQRGNSWKHV